MRHRWSASSTVACRRARCRRTPARDGGIEPQHLHGGDDAVAPERGRIPGDAGVGIGAFGRGRHQHVEIRHRPAQDLVDDRVGGLDRRHMPGRGLELALEPDEPAEERCRGLGHAAAARDRDEDRWLSPAGRASPCRWRCSCAGWWARARSTASSGAARRRGPGRTARTSLGPRTSLEPRPRRLRSMPRTSKMSAKSLANVMVKEKLTGSAPWFMRPTRSRSEPRTSRWCARCARCP